MNNELILINIAKEFDKIRQDFFNLYGKLGWDDIITDKVRNKFLELKVYMDNFKKVYRDSIKGDDIILFDLVLNGMENQITEIEQNYFNR